MAFVPFYLIAGGTGSADINAGSTIGAAVVGATTNGNWNSGTGVFISTGTPFGAATAGDYASIYVDGATVTTFVAKILTVDSTAQITVDVATIKYGTAPSTSATARSCVVGGSWNTEIVLAATGLGTTTVPQSTKINIKGNLTITASRTISMAGATTTPLWFSGYNTTPGDLDDDTTNSLAKPVWTLNSTFQITTSGTHQIWSSLSLVGSRSGTIWTASGAFNRYVRIRSDNTSANAAAIAMTASGVPSSHLYCWYRTPTTATTTGTMSVTQSTYAVGVVAEGGGKAAFGITGAINFFASQCVALNSAGSGFSSTSNAIVQIQSSTVYNSTSDGVTFTTNLPSAGTFSLVVGCLFAICGGYGINNSTGVNTNIIVRSCNDFYSCTPGPEGGFGDSPAFFQQTDGSSPVTSATDMTPIIGSNARNNGFPGVFEGGGALGSQINVGVDIGAVQVPGAIAVSISNVINSRAYSVIGY